MAKPTILTAVTCLENNLMKKLLALLLISPASFAGWGDVYLSQTVYCEEIL